MRVLWFGILFFAAAPGLAVAQAPPTPLAPLVAEAQRNNPGIRAAELAWRAARLAVAPAGALPDPQAMVQQVTIGSPAPFAGADTSAFAYTGIAISQQLPYPGKLKLRAAVAQGEAAVLRENWRQARRRLARQVEAAYDELAYTRAELAVLGRERVVLAAAAKFAGLRYRDGDGPQAAVLSAQLEQTQLLSDRAGLDRQWAAGQAELRALLNRPAAAAPVTPLPLRQTRLRASAAQLNADLSRSDLPLAAQQARIAAAGVGVSLARKNFRPDFSAQYMYQRMGQGMGNAYQWTLGMTLPWFHRASRYQPELERAVEQQDQARAAYGELVQQQRLQLADALLRVQNDAQILLLDRQGLLPQAAAAMTSSLTAYGAGQEDFQSFLDAWRRNLALERQYWSTLADHEIALSRVAELAGVPHD